MLGDIEGVAAAQWGLITPPQAYAAGFSVQEIKRLLRDGAWWAPRRGIYRPAPPPSADDPVERHALGVAAALLTLGRAGAVAGRVSAAILWKLEWFSAPDPATVWITCPPPAKPRYYSGLRILPAALPEHHVTIGPHGLPVTTLARTVADLLRELGYLDGLVVGESAARIHRIGGDEVLAVLRECQGWPGTGQAVPTARAISRLSGSVAESLARVVLAELGFTGYEQQAELRDRHGRMFVDFLFRSQWTIVEIDGAEKYAKDPRAGWKEKRREDRLRALGCEVVRLTWAELVGPACVVKAMIEAAFGRAARRGR